jgi:nicotinamide mononucleotide transporter
VLDFLFTPIPVLGQSTNPLELIAVVTGLASVGLAAKNHVLNWPVGLVNVICSLVILVRVKLYADSALQIFFAVLSIYGWIYWRGHGGRPAPVIHCPRRELVRVLLLTAAATAGTYLVLTFLTDGRLPVFDASILTLSVLATYLQARRSVESWFVWILVDLISIPVYFSRGLPFFAVLYVIFLVICFFGLAHWRRAMWQQSAPVPGRA